MRDISHPPSGTQRVPDHIGRHDRVEDRQRQPRAARTTLLLALSLIASLAISVAAVSSTTAGDHSILSVDDVRAPGMIRVDVPADALEQFGAYYRITWWEHVAAQQEQGDPLGSVVLDSPNRTTQGPVAITGLAAGTYDVEVDVVSGQSGYERVEAVDVLSGQIEVTAGALTEPCPQLPAMGEPLPVSLCAGLVDGSGQAVNAPVTVDFISGSTGTSGATLPDGQVGLVDRAQVDFWPKDNDNHDDGPAWSRIRMSMADRSGTYAVKWWSAFSDEGSSAETSTEFLVPDGGSVNLGDVVLDAGTAVFGELRKTDGSGSAPLEPADIVNPCTEVLRVVEGNNTQFVNAVCGFDGNPALRSDDAGKWRLGLAPGNYVFRFVDRANYFGADNILNYNVRFAPEWWREDGTRGERRSEATEVEVSEVDPIDPIAGINLGERVLRDAQQMRVDVTQIPDQLSGIDLEDIGLRANIIVTDEFGNWTGGAMEVNVGSRSASANVTGLVEDREYQVFLRFTGNNGFAKWWLIGGGSLDEASAIVPAGIVTETWQPSPILVTLHNEQGVPFGNDEACVALVPVGGSAAAASACTTNRLGAPGVVVLQRVPAGDYRVAAYRVDAQGGAIGAPVIIDEFTVDSNLPTAVFDTEYSLGLSDVTNLAPTAEFPGFPYTTSTAIVIAGEAN